MRAGRGGSNDQRWEKLASEKTREIGWEREEKIWVEMGATGHLILEMGGVV